MTSMYEDFIDFFNNIRVLLLKLKLYIKNTLEYI